LYLVKTKGEKKTQHNNKTPRTTFYLSKTTKGNQKRLAKENLSAKSTFVNEVQDISMET